MDEMQMLIDVQKTLAGMGIDLSALIGEDFNPDEPFTEDLFTPIAQRYEFQPDSILTVRIVLNVAVAFSNLEAKWTSTDLSKVRKKFEGIKRHSRALLQALQDLDEEDLYAANEAATGQAYASTTEITQLFEMEKNKPTASLSCDGNRVTIQLPEKKLVHLDELSETLKALDEAMDLSLRFSGKGKTGRPKDSTLEALLMIAFQMYEHFTGKAFTLYWHDDNAPISEAACFCTDLVRVFDSQVSSSKIVSVASAVRKNSNKVNDLEEGLEFAKQYSKRSS